MPKPHSNSPSNLLAGTAGIALLGLATALLLLGPSSFAGMAIGAERWDWFAGLAVLQVFTLISYLRLLKWLNG